MGHLEGNFTPVLYMGRKVPKVKYSHSGVAEVPSPVGCGFVSVGEQSMSFRGVIVLSSLRSSAAKIRLEKIRELLATRHNGTSQKTSTFGTAC